MKIAIIFIVSVGIIVYVRRLLKEFDNITIDLRENS